MVKEFMGKDKFIPNSLKLLSQWMCWQSRPKDNGKTDKIPINPHTGKLAKTNDPKTWGTFDQAVQYYEKHKGKGVDGIGFVFTKDDPYAGIDLDGCRNPETGVIEPWAVDIIKSINSYSEVSPSGTGVKIFCKGVLLGGGMKKGNIEIYDRGRFFTITGDVIE